MGVVTWSRPGAAIAAPAAQTRVAVVLESDTGQAAPNESVDRATRRFILESVTPSFFVHLLCSPAESYIQMGRGLRGSRTATPAIHDAKWRHSAALSESEALFLNGTQRSVNRKVQGSNPWSGAKPDVQVRLLGDKTPSAVVLHTFGHSLQPFRYLRDTPRP